MTVMYKRTRRVLSIFLTLITMSVGVFAQNVGDYQTSQSGNYTLADRWEEWNGASWVAAATSPPSNNTTNVAVKHAITFDQSRTVNNLTIDATQTLTVSSGVTLTLGTNSTINGTLDVSGTVDFGSFVASGSGTVTINIAAEVYTQHASGLNTAVSASGSVQTTTINFSPRGLYHYNAAVTQNTGNGIPALNTGGIMYAEVASSNVTPATQNDARLILSNTITVNTGATFTYANAGSNRYLVDLGAFNVTGVGTFTMLTKSGLIISDGVGITSIASILSTLGQIRTSGGRTYSATGTYIYKTATTGVTGDALSAASNIISYGPGTLTLGSAMTSGNVFLYGGTFNLTFNALTLNTSANLFCRGGNINVSPVSNLIVSTTSDLQYDGTGNMNAGNEMLAGFRTIFFNTSAASNTITLIQNITIPAATVSIRMIQGKLSKGAFALAYNVNNKLRYLNTAAYTTGDEFLASGMNIDIQSTGILTLNENKTGFTAQFTIATGGILNDNGFYVDGTGSVTFQSSCKAITTFATGFNVTSGPFRTSTVNLGSGTNIFEYAGNVAQVTGTQLGATVNTIIINNSTADVTLSNTTTLTNLTLTSGKIILGNLNLTIPSGGTLSGGSASSYVVQNGTGALRREVGASNVLFAIGSSTTSYTPATLNNSGTVDNYRVDFLNGVLLNGTSGGPHANAHYCVNKSWDITEEVVGGSNLTITFGWGTADENASFDRSVSKVQHYISGAWDNVATAGSAAGNPSAGRYTQSVSGVSSLSPFAVNGSPGNLNPLPVKLVAFDVVTTELNTAKLTWVTASEENNDRFEVQRSFDGVNYLNIGTVRGNGTTQATINYSFTDHNSVGTILYYRLRQVDYNGQFEFSPVRVLKGAESNGMQITALYPLPAAENINVSVTAHKNDNNVSLQIISLNGTAITTKTVGLLRGVNSFNIPVLDLQPGKYIIRVSGNVNAPQQQIFIKL